jgi:hypothetical protein
MKTSRLGFAAAALIALHPPAFAEDGCGRFAWSLAREQALFAVADKPAVKAGDTLPAIPKGAFVLTLQNGADAAFAIPPERKPKSEHWFGGMLHLPAPGKSGIVQVTLSDEAWIDIVQDGRYARSLGSTGRSDCPGLRKSVRFELGAAPFVLQLSGVASDRPVVAVSQGEQR